MGSGYSVRDGQDQTPSPLPSPRHSHWSATPSHDPGQSGPEDRSVPWNWGRQERDPPLVVCVPNALVCAYTCVAVGTRLGRQSETGRGRTWSDRGTSWSSHRPLTCASGSEGVGADPNFRRRELGSGVSTSKWTRVGDSGAEGDQGFGGAVPASRCRRRRGPSDPRGVSGCVEIEDVRGLMSS